MPELDPRLRVILEDSFYIRTTMIRRRSGGPRTVETTYYWNGAAEVVLSGYPGRRDWVANINANPTVTLHTAEFEPWFDIPGRGRGPVGHQRTPALSAELHWPVDGEAGIPAPPVRVGSRGDQDQPKTEAAMVGAVLVYPKNLRPDAVRRGHVCRRSDAPAGRATGPVGAARGPSLSVARVPASERPRRRRRPGQESVGTGILPSTAFFAMSRVSVSNCGLPAIHSR